MNKPILCLDFDGVLHSYSSGWKGADQIPDPPTPGAMMFLHHAINYFDVQIYSSRSGQPGGIQAMQDWLNYNVADFFDCTFAGAPSDMDKTEAVLAAISFPTSKPAAFLTIDDRALCFTGNWADFYPQDLLEFKPWNKRSPQCEPSPAYPNGLDVDLRAKKNARGCVTELPYPAPRCGIYLVVCEKCGYSAAITTAGRPDDPKQVTMQTELTALSLHVRSEEQP